MTNPQTTLTLNPKDYFQLEGVCDAAANEYVWYRHPTKADGVSTTVYPKYLIRYKTSAASDGLGAKVELEYDDASEQWLLGTETIPEFSTTWKLASGTLNSGRTIEEVRFYADDYPDATAAGTFQVYFDFLLIYGGDFTFPHMAHGFSFKPNPRNVVVPILGRVGDVTQGLGSELAEWNLRCNLDLGFWKRGTVAVPTDYMDGEVFVDIAHNSFEEPWQWFDDGIRQCKVTLNDPDFSSENMGDATSNVLNLMLREYRLSDASNETHVERFSLDQ